MKEKHFESKLVKSEKQGNFEERPPLKLLSNGKFNKFGHFSTH